jgi:hypothetical protein
LTLPASLAKHDRWAFGVEYGTSTGVSENERISLGDVIHVNFGNWVASRVNHHYKDMNRRSE